MKHVMTKNNELLTPLPGRWLSAVIALGCLFLLWWCVLNLQQLSHGVAAMLLITSALSSFHAFGWKSRYVGERWLFSPVGSFVLIALTVLLYLTG